MWELVNPRIRLWLILATALALGFTGALIKGGFSSTNILLQTLASVPFLLLIGLIAGSWVKASWTYPCKHGLSKWYPDLNGEWRGTLTSSHQEDGNDKEVEITLTIDQRWHHIEVTSQGAEGYSKSVAIHVTPENRDGQSVLWTHFLGTVAKPEPTDASIFYGSSRMVYDRANDALDGEHWTNRAWHTGGNTAGSFHLERL